MIRKKILLSTVLCIAPVLIFSGCKKDEPETTAAETSVYSTIENTTDETTVETTTTEIATTEPAATEAPTTQAVVAETDAPAPTYTAWSLLSDEPLNPQKSGYEELDNLVSQVIDKCVTDDMNGYQKVWACYQYMIDNITYSRGFADNTGAYSSSDPATTPVEVLWATDLLNSGLGACYNYSSTFVYIMRALGYDAHLVSGNVPAYNGGVTPHCWLYVNLGGNKYTFDPDLDMNYYTRGDNPSKDIWFCIPIETMAYFYKAETYHTN